MGVKANTVFIVVELYDNDFSFTVHETIGKARKHGRAMIEEYEFAGLKPTAKKKEAVAKILRNFDEELVYMSDNEAEYCVYIVQEEVK